MRRLLPLLALLAACSPYPVPYRGAVEVRPTLYEAYWGMAEICSQRSGDLASWRFWSVDAPILVFDNGDSAIAVTLSRTWHRRDGDVLIHDIVTIRDSMMAWSTVGHEMLHALGEPRHPYDLFVTRCRVENDQSIRFQEGVKPSDIPPGHKR